MGPHGTIWRWKVCGVSNQSTGARELPAIVYHPTLGRFWIGFGGLCNTGNWLSPQMSQHPGQLSTPSTWPKGVVYIPTYCGWTKSCTTLKPRETVVCCCLLVFTGESSTQGSFGGAKWISSMDSRNQVARNVRSARFAKLESQLAAQQREREVRLGGDSGSVGGGGLSREVGHCSLGKWGVDLPFFGASWLGESEGGSDFLDAWELDTISLERQSHRSGHPKKVFTTCKKGNY